MTPEQAVDDIIRLAPSLVDDANSIGAMWLERRLLEGNVAFVKRHLNTARRRAEPDEPDVEEVTDEQARAHIASIRARHESDCRSFIERARAFHEAFECVRLRLAGMLRADGVSAGDRVGASACEILDRLAVPLAWELEAGALPEAGYFAGLDWRQLGVLVQCEVAALAREREESGMSNQRAGTKSVRTRLIDALRKLEEQKPGAWFSSKDVLHAADLKPGNRYYEEKLSELARDKEIGHRKERAAVSYSIRAPSPRRATHRA